MICDKCNANEATVFVTSHYAWGGNPAFGTYRSRLCDSCQDVEVKMLSDKGFAARVDQLRTPATT